MDDEIAELRKAIEEERQLRKAIEEERRRLGEEQRRRERAEELVRISQPQALHPYLDLCHSLNLSIRVFTDPSSTTQGDTTNPTGRLVPQRIIPWDNFPTEQEEIWNHVSKSELFCSQPAFPSQHQLDYVKSVLRPVGSEIGLRHFERCVVEHAVEMLIYKACKDAVLRRNLGIQGTITFESDTNRADQFCIYRTSDGRRFPTLAIEYKAPHKLSVDEVVTGLESEIQPGRDIIHKDGDDFTFAARHLTAAAITQLFSYMIGKGIQYGYVCTGQAFVFLHIPADPAMVYYHVSVPHQDVMDNDELRLHRTAVAQVFALVLQALHAEPPPQSWHDAAAALDTWAVEYDDVLRDIPATIRKETRTSSYKPQRWKGFKRSPIRTRSSHCQQLDADIGRTDDNDEKDPPSLSPKPSRSGRKAAFSKDHTSIGGSHSEQRRDPQSQQQQQRAAKPNIQERPFCTQQCLLGLAYGRLVDPNCPNSEYHGRWHLSRQEFLRLIRAQLAVDRGREADCTPLHLSGSRGSLFKVRLSSHGYTLVAKGMESPDRAFLEHENDMYDRLQGIQGEHIPVCLGSVDLVRPYYYNGGVYTRFMFLSWAGQPLFDGTYRASKADVVAAVTTMFKAVHGQRVLHRDAEPRNILYDAKSGKLMVVDFERAEFQPLGSIDSNGHYRKRRRRISQEQEKDVFAQELESIVEAVSRCVATHVAAGIDNDLVIGM